MIKKKLLQYGKKVYFLSKERGLIRGLLNMEMKKVKTAFIGCGKHATENIYPSLRYSPIKLLATCAQHMENARRNAEWFGAANYYDDYKKMLDVEKPDAVIIVVNAELHAEIACEALKRNIHVFLEKPPALDMEGTRQIVEEAGKSQKKVIVGFQRRYAPAYVKAKELMQTKGFGASEYIQTKLCTGRMISGTNFILDIGIHHIDMVRFLFGEVSSFFVNSSNGASGKTYVINLKFENGAVGSMVFSEKLSWFYHNERIEIAGSGSCIEIDNVCKLTYFNQGVEVLGIPISQIIGGQKGKVVWEPNFTCMTKENSLLYQSGMIGELQHFCDCILNNAKPNTGIEDAYKTMTLVSQISEKIGLKST